MIDKEEPQPTSSSVYNHDDNEQEASRTPDSSPARRVRQQPSPLRRNTSQSSNDADSSTDTGELLGISQPKLGKWIYRKMLQDMQTKLEDKDEMIIKLTNRVINAELELENKSSELLTSLLAVEEAEETIKRLKHRVQELEESLPSSVSHEDV